MLDHPGFDVLPHTADVGIVARGTTLGEAFAQAACGMYALMVDLDHVEHREMRTLTLEAPDLERLLVRWLVDLLFLTETQGMVFSSFEVEVDAAPPTLRARMSGEPLDPARHDARYDVKAVTYHDLEVAPEPGGWRLRVILDV
jgi:SHS2 domain-containing protein